MPESLFSSKKRSYGSASKQLEQLEEEQAKEAKQMMPMNPVVRDLGIDRHIGYKEISPAQAEEKDLTEMTIDEIIARSKKKK